LCEGERCERAKVRACHEGLRRIYDAFVAVTTATEDGVAMPSMGAGAGGGLLPAGGGVDAALPPPPQPAIATNKMQEDAMSNERMRENPPGLVC
jgi:hypothetical protein